MSTPSQRLEIAKFIVDFEARRDDAGRIKVYKLPAGDGGGTYEVAGINDKYHPQEAAALRDLILQRRHEDAERQAAAYIATYTDSVLAWTSITAIEAFLRDCAFNRGAGGAAKIFQLALGVEPDGRVGKITMDAAEKQIGDGSAKEFLGRLREMREYYERNFVGRDEKSKFWKGLVNRWNKAAKMASAYL